jgi:hypothetical protein
MSFCAIWASDATGERTANIDGHRVVVCADCDAPPIPPSSRRYSVTDGDARAERIRARRAELVAQRLCRNGPKHGAATHGQLCIACHGRMTRYDRSFRKRATP